MDSTEREQRAAGLIGSTHVRIFGPDLNEAATQKGVFHVHTEGCNDIHHYGEGKRYGGTDPVGFLFAVDTPDEVADGLGRGLGELYFAPCLKLDGK